MTNQLICFDYAGLLGASLGRRRVGVRNSSLKSL